MDSASKIIIQEKVNSIPFFWNKKLHSCKETPKDFRPWTCNLSPSALYNCGLSCRKKMGIKTIEYRWISIKRWNPITPKGIHLPPGVFMSVKRHEAYFSDPKPYFSKIEYLLIMFPYGNVWSQRAPGVPIDENWLWSETKEMTVFEALVRKDAMHPIHGYFKSTYDYMIANPQEIGIHQKRVRKLSHKEDSKLNP